MSPRADGAEPTPPPADGGGRDRPDQGGLRDLDPRAVAADDVLLAALGAGLGGDAGGALVDALTWDDQPLTPAQPEPEPAEGGPAEGEPSGDRVTALLAALRADVGRDLPIHWGAADPLRAPVARPARRGVLRLVPRTVAVASATAVVLSAGGVAAAAVGAGPQSWLYPLHRMLVTDQGPGASARAAAQVRRDLAAAGAALDVGDTARAGASLAGARHALPAVAAADGAAELADRLAALTARLAAMSAPPASPAPSAPAGEGSGADAPRPPAPNPAASHRPAPVPHGPAGGHARGHGHDGGSHPGRVSRPPHRTGGGSHGSHRSGSGGSGRDGAGGGTSEPGSDRGSDRGNGGRAKGSGGGTDRGDTRRPAATRDAGGSQDGGKATRGRP